MELLSYLLKRFLLMIPTLFGITLVTFFIMKLAPGDPAMLKLRFANENINPETLAAILKSRKPALELPDWYLNTFCAESHALDRIRTRFANPLADRLLRLEETRSCKAFKWIGENGAYYGKWMANISPLEWNPGDARAAFAEARDEGKSGIALAPTYVKAAFKTVLRWPGFGLSIKDNRPVMEKIREKLPITLLINVLTIAVVYIVSIPLGIWSAIRKGSVLDKIVMVKLFIFYSLPTFWVATMLLMIFAGGEYLNLFPLMGYKSNYHEQLGFFQRIADVAWHLTLPVLADTIGSFAFLARFSRSNFLEVVRQDYMRTARAKGLPERKVLFKHGLRNALIPFVTLMGTLLPALLGGSVIIEQIFNIPGMGMLSFEAVLSRDHNVIMGIATIGAVLTLLGILISDILYTFVDPRISLR